MNKSDYWKEDDDVGELYTVPEPLSIGCVKSGIYYQKKEYEKSIRKNAPYASRPQSPFQTVLIAWSLKLSNHGISSVPYW